MAERFAVRELIHLQNYRGEPSIAKVDFAYGELAVDALSHATAADLIGALRGHVPLEPAKIIVELLLDNGLLFDSTLESELGG